MFYVQDGTIKILEPPIRNSGFAGGTFLSRRVVKDENNEPITERSMFNGSKLHVLRHVFLLHETNDATLRWMEEHRLPKASFYDIIDKLRSSLYSEAASGNLAKKFASVQTNEYGRVTMDGLRQVLNSYNLVGDEEYQLVEHELLTIVRANGNKENSFDYTKVIEQIIQPTDEFK